MRHNYSYYILISGQDYPIKPIEELVTLLHDTYPKPYIDTTPYAKGEWIPYKFSNTKAQNFVRRGALRVNRLFDFKVRGLDRLQDIVQKVSIKVMPSAYTKLKKLNVNIYSGSAWWALPDKAVEEILQDMDAHPDITDTFKWSFTPEETFFQTMVMRTSLAPQVIVKPSGNKSLSCLTYSNFFPPTQKVSSCHPYIITEEDWFWLQHRKEYFARKFDLELSLPVLDRLDQAIKKRNHE